MRLIDFLTRGRSGRVLSTVLSLACFVVTIGAGNHWH